VRPDRRPEWWPVARWELLRILRRPDFVLSVVFTPVLVIGLSMGMRALTQGRTHTVAVVRVDATGSVTERGESVLGAVDGVRWADPGAAGADIRALGAAVAAKTFEAAVVLPADFGVRDDTVHMVTRRGPSAWTREIEAHVGELRVRERAAAFGLDSGQLVLLRSELPVRQHSGTGESARDRRGTRIVVLAILMLMITVILTSISYLMVGISGEKTARVTEVVVSAISPQSWMDAKILAFTAVGLIVGLTWAGSLLLIAGPLAFRLPSSVDPGYGFVTMVYAVLGLMLYNAFLAALMASAQNMQTASRWQGNFIMLPFVPVTFLGALMDSPDATWLTVLSHFPFFSPILIPARLALGAVAAWELSLGVVVLAGSFWFMRIAAGRVFRMGMLMYGKDMTLPELIRWARVK
jgi:ABC-2 type transport system permease protein